jgi:hypothetical protein
VASGPEAGFVQSVNRVNPADLLGESRSDHRLTNELDGRCLRLRACDEVYDDGANIPTGAVGRQRPLVGLDVNQKRPEPTVFLRGDGHGLVMLNARDIPSLNDSLRGHG